MLIDPAFAAAGRFRKGNIHTHSTRSDGALSPADVCSAYREAGYDFIALTDHFLAKFDFPIVDTRPLRSGGFTTIIGAELHARETSFGELWHILAVGLPLDFSPPTAAESGAALARRAHDAGAFIAIAHPAAYAVTTTDAESVPAHAIEIFNNKSHVQADRGDGTYLADQLHAAGRRIALCAVDDAHFHFRDCFGGYVMVKAADNEPEALLASLRSGAFYSSQGPVIEDVIYREDAVEVACSPAAVVMALGRGSRAVQRLEPGMTRVALPLDSLRSGRFARVVVTDAEGRRAWTNPVWW